MSERIVGNPLQGVPMTVYVKTDRCQICNAEPCECADWPEELVAIARLSKRLPFSEECRLAGEYIQRLANRIAGLEGIVAKLPKTADGVAVFIGDHVWDINTTDGSIADTVIVSNYTDDDEYQLALWHPVVISRCYSTREAALAAKEQK